MILLGSCRCNEHAADEAHPYRGIATDDPGPSPPVDGVPSIAESRAAGPSSIPPDLYRRRSLRIQPTEALRPELTRGGSGVDEVGVANHS
jgi:hypothetical protein